ncbi:hypothetical protein LCGC14_1297240 [marine sediment metagenome]|uniref:Uncharacterized protein n=1 Tax=marine sediment metagenome TaxID=412755 RepID=A0A0F9KSB8_9ZZZZ
MRYPPERTPSWPPPDPVKYPGAYMRWQEENKLSKLNPKITPLVKESFLSDNNGDGLGFFVTYMLHIVAFLLIAWLRNNEYISLWLAIPSLVAVLLSVSHWISSAAETSIDSYNKLKPKHKHAGEQMATLAELFEDVEERPTAPPPPPENPGWNEIMR